MPRPGRPSYRGLLKATVAASSAPYGYTLTLWTTGVTATGAQGRAPTALDALLLAFGAVVAYSVVGVVATGGLGRALESGPRNSTRLWGALHFLPLAANVGVCSLVLREIHGRLAWPLAGFIATTIYLMTTAAQFWCASLRRKPSRSSVKTWTKSVGPQSQVDS